MLLLLILASIFWAYGCVSIIMSAEDALLPDSWDKFRTPIICLIAILWPIVFCFVAIYLFLLVTGIIVTHTVVSILLQIDEISRKYFQ